MKRLIAAAVLTVLIIGIYLTGFFYINHTCEETKTLIEDCVSSYEKNDNTELYTQKLQNYWSGKERMLSVFTNHKVIDDIELAIESLSVHSKFPKNNMFYEYSSTLKTLLHQLMEDTVPSMHSIL